MAIPLPVVPISSRWFISEEDRPGRTGWLAEAERAADYVNPDMMGAGNASANGYCRWRKNLPKNSENCSRGEGETGAWYEKFEDPVFTDEGDIGIHWTLVIPLVLSARSRGSGLHWLGPRLSLSVVVKDGLTLCG